VSSKYTLGDPARRPTQVAASHRTHEARAEVGGTPGADSERFLWWCAGRVSSYTVAATAAWPFGVRAFARFYRVSAFVIPGTRLCAVVKRSGS